MVTDGLKIETDKVVSVAVEDHVSKEYPVEAMVEAITYRLENRADIYVEEAVVVPIVNPFENGPPGFPCNFQRFIFRLHIQFFQVGVPGTVYTV